MEKFYVGVDVGGTSIKMGMFSHTGELLEKWEIPTRVDEDEQTDRILPDIAASIEEKRAEKNGNIVGIGLGIPCLLYTSCFGECGQPGSGCHGGDTGEGYL